MISVLSSTSHIHLCDNFPNDEGSFLGNIHLHSDTVYEISSATTTTTSSTTATTSRSRPCCVDHNESNCSHAISDEDNNDDDDYCESYDSRENTDNDDIIPFDECEYEKIISLSSHTSHCTIGSMSACSSTVALVKRANSCSEAATSNFTCRHHIVDIVALRRTCKSLSALSELTASHSVTSETHIVAMRAMHRMSITLPIPAAENDGHKLNESSSSCACSSSSNSDKAKSAPTVARHGDDNTYNHENEIFSVKTNEQSDFGRAAPKMKTSRTESALAAASSGDFSHKEATRRRRRRGGKAAGFSALRNDLSYYYSLTDVKYYNLDDEDDVGAQSANSCDRRRDEYDLELRTIDGEQK